MEENVFDINKISNFSLQQQEMIRKAVIHLFENREKDEEIASLLKNTENFEYFIAGRHPQEEQIIKVLDIFLTKNQILNIEDLFFAYLSEVFLNEIQNLRKGSINKKYIEDMNLLSVVNEGDKREFIKGIISEITKDYGNELNNISKIFLQIINESSLKCRLSEFWEGFSSEARVNRKYRS